ncbi:MAG: hypothetical protein WC412_05120 [Candidatus Omnitrophota bacterium]|jgi:hypothetical protein
MKKLNFLLSFIIVAAILFFAYEFGVKYFLENQVLKQVINRLNTDSRVAEVIVTDVKYDKVNRKDITTIKFVEFDTRDKPLAPRYFTFSGNTIQFQSLVVRFNDAYVKSGDRLRGKSIYLFWKVFLLDGENTQVYDLVNIDEVPAAYKIFRARNKFEDKIWKKFWNYALNSQEAKRMGIKNAQIEAPGTRFIPGFIYTISIEHDGGLRIDTLLIPEILRGEKIPS